MRQYNDFFLDTNFFLQCKSYDQINWIDITSDKIIEIYITRPVQDEIDRLKNDGNTRRAKRARKSNSLFRKILLSDDMFLEEKNRTIKIIFKFSKNYTREELNEVSNKLDLKRSDDEIIASLIKFIQDNNIDNAHLLTHDTNPILTAKTNNVPVKIIPDAWLLPPEPDARDKKIKRLEEKLKSIIGKEPKIKFNFKIESIDFENQNITIKMKKNTDLGNSDIKEILDAFQRKYPMKEDFSEELENKEPEKLLPSNSSIFYNKIKIYIPPTKEEIEEYKNNKYPNWIEELKKYIENYQKSKNYFERIKTFTFSMKYVGNAPVENLILEFNVIKGALIASPNFRDWIESHSIDAPPKVPLAPKGRWELEDNSIFTSINKLREHMPFISSPRIDIPPVPLLKEPVHDRYGFYWDCGKLSLEQKKWTFHCDEFRHKSETESFTYYFIFSELETDDEFVFQIIISGSNIREPIIKKHVAKIVHEKVDVKDEIMQIIAE